MYDDINISRTGAQFWWKHQRILSHAGMTIDDAHQQAALIVAEGQASQLWCRLLDWMRSVTQYDHHTKRRPIYLTEEPAKLVDRVATSLRAVDRQAEYVNVARVACEKAKTLGPRYHTIIHAVLDGESGAELARTMNISEGRISQMLKQITRSIALSVILATSFAPTLFAQTPPCFTASWQANTEADLGGYHLTIVEDGIAQPMLTYPATDTQSECITKKNAEYDVALTAFDTFGNESAPTTIHKDLKPPSAPLGLQITIKVEVTVP